MIESMSEYLQRDMEWEGLLECIHGHKQLDRECYRAIVESGEPMTVDEIAEAVGRERSTAYRAVQRLIQSGIVQKEQVNYEQGGYYHVYQPRDPDDIAQEMQRTLNDWYAKMGNLIGEFSEKYAEEPAPPSSAQS